ncbi:GxxExxY protein [Flavobacterium sp. F372]|jgi:GxxExxY protein|uniref:GxxExxY protein n=1 Tax=Flavobacterium bernardetii TaxID=2813823 RepID=A0ABR7IY10_9FLAO|nr:GxxExxY protein [Flavobacterium bernardetii]MBC5834537.1 GxxExxY protein [Flavobacterium bernardetii]NHF70185.1 GxxExxY protein [Flavobacterium bernardetii]
MSENEISRIIVDVAYKIHIKLGPGLLESVYEAIMCHELIKRGLKVERQKPIPVIWDEIFLDIGFRSDLIVEDKVIVELKSVETLSKVHSKQILTYLKITNMKLGLLINFNEALIRDGIYRVVNGL